MVEEHIKELLHEHDCVIIPDFGGLITHYASARIHPVKHTLVPPSLRIAFNEKLKINDGLLINSLVQLRKLGAADARQQVADFVAKVREELNERYKYEMRGIGLFRLNREHKVEFEYIETENLLHDSFGLPELVSRPVLPPQPVKMRNPFRDRPATAPAPEPRTLRMRLHRAYRVAAAVLIGSVAFSGLYYLSQQSEATLSSLNPMTLFNADQNRVVEAAPEQPTVMAFVPQYSAEEIKDMHLEYFPTGHVEEIYSDNQQLDAPNGDITWEEYTGALNSDGEVILENEDSSWDEPTVKAPVAQDETIPAPVPTPEVKVPAPKQAETAKVPEVKNPAAPIKETAKAAAAPAKVVKAAKSPQANLVKAPTGRFYIIGGGFTTLGKAQEIEAKLRKTGLDPKIIPPSGKGQLHRVSLADFDSREIAVEAMKIFKPKHGSSIWILTY